MISPEAEAASGLFTPGAHGESFSCGPSARSRASSDWDWRSCVARATLQRSVVRLAGLDQEVNDLTSYVLSLKRRS
jgi:hypothetical protein